jgi:hypothetical protein
VQSFNRAVGSFDTRILPAGARKFAGMGISARKDVPEVEPIKRGTREIQSKTTLA